MFKSNEKEESNNFHESDDTVIGRSIKIEGDLVSNGSIVIEGEVIGSLKTEQTLRVGENAKVKAEVKAKEAFISGKVDGNVSVDSKLELASTAELNGDIKAQTLSIAAGAIFNGRSTMTENSGAVQLKIEAKSGKDD
ncbi:polymer-forming cytoskeletal protein [Candidatus Falkowbacteria bacterium]|nr:polymer-forming cytoskeletal protein [Candidatus Falkowbacteria bacterium]